MVICEPSSLIALSISLDLLETNSFRFTLYLLINDGRSSSLSAKSSGRLKALSNGLILSSMSYPVLSNANLRHSSNNSCVIASFMRS
jgi:hypothetical protein